MNKEILEGNKLIAEFIGWSQQLDVEERWYGAWFDQHGVRKAWPKGHEPLLFHKSWDWLMPVIGKISSNCEKPEELDGLKYALLSDDIETAWGFVADYLKFQTNNSTRINH